MKVEDYPRSQQEEGVLADVRLNGTKTPNLREFSRYKVSRSYSALLSAIYISLNILSAIAKVSTILYTFLNRLVMFYL